MKTEKYVINKNDFIEYKSKRESRILLQKAVRSNQIEKPERCEHCECKTALHGHHIDYGKPLDVVWLCSKCHAKCHSPFHPLNPNNHQQSYDIRDRWRSKDQVVVSVSIDAAQFIALKKKSIELKMPISKLVRISIKETFKVDNGQLEFEFNER